MSQVIWPPILFQRRLWLLCFGSIVCLLWLIAISNTSSTPAYLRASSLGLKTEAASRNRTLGFGKILMAVLPKRTDQRDTVALLSHLSEIDITVVDGVEKDSILDKVIPKGTYRPKGGQLGCWRAHMEMLRIVIEEKLETALLLEADVDWDVRIKDQLTGISKHINHSTPDYPYGTDWKVLWLGHCWHAANPDNLGPVVTYPDETVAPLKTQWQSFQNESKIYGVEQDGMRMIYQANNPLCMAAYAITLDGALRMLYEVGYDHLDGPVDKEFQKATKRGKLPGTVINPPLMAQWKTGTYLDSDINEKPTGSNDRSGNSGAQVQMSVRKTLKKRVYADRGVGDKV